MKQSFSYNRSRTSSVLALVSGLLMAFIIFKIGVRIDFPLFKYLGIIAGLGSSANSIFQLVSDHSIKVTDLTVVFPPKEITQRSWSIPLNEIFSIEKLKSEQAIIKTIHGKSFTLIKVLMKSGEYENLLEILENKKSSDAKPTQAFQKNRIKERLLPYIGIIAMSLVLIWMATRTL